MGEFLWGNCVCENHVFFWVWRCLVKECRKVLVGFDDDYVVFIPYPMIAMIPDNG